MEPNAPPSPPVETRAGSPFRPEPEQPRLGIAHLLAWTACVAVYFSITRTLYGADPAGGPVAPVLIWFLEGLGSGTALGGLPLLVVRRRRGLSFPGQPGETLWVLLGLGAAIGLAVSLLVSGAAALGGGRVDLPSMLYYRPFSPVTSLVLGGVYLIVAGHLGVRRWRVYFVAAAAGNLFSCCMPGFRFFSSVVLAVVALKDASEQVGYRWTHWLGVGLDLWFGATSLVWFGWWWFYAARQLA